MKTFKRFINDNTAALGGDNIRGILKSKTFDGDDVYDSINQFHSYHPTYTSALQNMQKYLNIQGIETDFTDHIYSTDSGNESKTNFDINGKKATITKDNDKNMNPFKLSIWK